jgi:hypothetical protein
VARSRTAPDHLGSGSNPPQTSGIGPATLEVAVTFRRRPATRVGLHTYSSSLQNGSDVLPQPGSLTFREPDVEW